MSTAVKTSPATVATAPTIAEAPAPEAPAPAPITELEDDPDTDERAWGRWVMHLVVGVAIGIPALTLIMGGALAAFTDATTTGAFVIAFWVSLWAGVFAGGTAGSVVYDYRYGHH